MRRVIFSLFLAGALLLVAAGLAQAQRVQAGDIELRFRTQIENDFEYRDNYDLNDNVPHVSGDTRDGLFVETEVRFGMDARGGNWRTHILFEAEDLWDRNNEGGGSGTLGLERAWGEYNFGPFTLQAGPSVLFGLDPADLVYSDDDPMVRAYGKTAGVSWQFGWSRRNDDGDDGGVTRIRDQDIIQGSVTFPLKNGGLSLDVTPFILYNHDKTQGPTLDTIYLGLGATGTIWGVQTLAQFTYLTGTDDTTRNCTGATCVAGAGVDVNAWAALLSLAYPIPNTPLTLEVGGVWATGDDNPNDLDAEAFTGVFHDTEVFNSDGIWIDDDIRVIPSAGGTLRVKEDDKHWTTLVPAGITRGLGNTEDFNLSHPGIQLYTAALHYKATPSLNLSAIYQHIRTFETIAEVGADPVAPAVVTSLTGLAMTEKHLGDEIGLRAVWQVEKFVTITPAIGYFIPGDGLKNIVGQDDPAFNAIVEVFITF